MDVRSSFIASVERLTSNCHEASERTQRIDELLAAIKQLAAEAEAVHARALALAGPAGSAHDDRPGDSQVLSPAARVD
jgi:DNA anti-recombination protein RmuC